MIEYVDFLPTFIDVAGGQPAAVLDGKSLLPVFQGKQSHKSLVFGEMTTRGINSGADHFGIRSVRSERFKFIWNFTPEIEFKNACTGSPEFRSWKKAVESGNENAKELVGRYTTRPEFELYDIQSDPLEMNNLASNNEHATIKSKLQQQLKAWMKRCGDQGQPTEMAALEHMRRGQQQPAKKPRAGKRRKKSVQ